MYPSENEADVITARSVHKNSISGTIWSMCFISKDPNQPSKGHDPVLAILLNRYDNYGLGSLRFHALKFFCLSCFYLLIFFWC